MRVITSYSVFFVVALSLCLTSCGGSSGADQEVTLAGTAFVPQEVMRLVRDLDSNFAANAPVRIVDASNLDSGVSILESETLVSGVTNSNGEFSALTKSLALAGIIVSGPVTVKAIVPATSDLRGIRVDGVSTIAVEAIDTGVRGGAFPSAANAVSRIEQLERAAEAYLDANPEIDFTDLSQVQAAAANVRDAVVAQAPEVEVVIDAPEDNVAGFSHSFTSDSLISVTGGCGLGNFSYSASEVALFVDSFGANSDVSFGIIGDVSARATGLIILGVEDHTCTINNDGNGELSVQCTNPQNGFCSEQYTSLSNQAVTN